MIRFLSSSHMGKAFGFKATSSLTSLAKQAAEKSLQATTKVPASGWALSAFYKTIKTFAFGAGLHFGIISFEDRNNPFSIKTDWPKLISLSKKIIGQG